MLAADDSTGEQSGTNHLSYATPVMTKVLVTGAAGFLGYHVARKLLGQGVAVVGVDCVNSYYSTQLKRDRLAELAGFGNWRFFEGNIADPAVLKPAFAEIATGPVVHLAAQAGVRWSLSHPEAYVESNLVSFGAILEAARHAGTRHLVYASSSSVYGGDASIPFSTKARTDQPLSFYAATKKANEVMAYSYSHLFDLPTTGLRFFSVYGPWGRPDMAYWKFTDALLRGTPITVYGDGSMRRDFTYVDDVVDVVVRIGMTVPEDLLTWQGVGQPTEIRDVPSRIYNVGNDRPVSVSEMLRILEPLCGRTANLVFENPSAADVPATWADISELRRDFGYSPTTSIEAGLTRFVEWYRGWSGI
jgi:UDP-glucuronate 4-epimerase